MDTRPTISGPSDEPIRTPAELEQRWRGLVGPEPFSIRSLWLTWLDHRGRMLPLVVPVDDVPESPEGQLLDGLVHIAADVLDEHAPGGSVAMLLCRPGSSAVHDGDRAWARALGALSAGGLSLQPLHVAAAGAVRPMAPDDLLGVP